jgi:pyruvate dehydrogenase E1 component alpha subunit
METRSEPAEPARPEAGRTLGVGGVGGVGGEGSESRDGKERDESYVPKGALRDDGSLNAEAAATLSDDLATGLYEHMILARMVDERLVAAQRDGKIGAHSSVQGEEAVVIGAAAAMRDDDWLFLSSREVAAAHWRGMPLTTCAHHAFATKSAAGYGRSAPSPPAYRNARVASVTALVGTQIPHAVGVAWAARLRGKDVAALVFFGEGATSSSDFHTGLNFAGVSRAPLVAVCRNNGWAASTPAAKQTASQGFAVKALAYGLRGVRVDGGDVVAVLGAVREARARGSRGEGGTLVEAVTTPRWTETPMAGSARDPLTRMRRHLEFRGIWNTEREEQVRASMVIDVDAAFAEAEAAKGPSGESLFENVYAELPGHLLEQRRDFLRGSTGARP